MDKGNSDIADRLRGLIDVLDLKDKEFARRTNQSPNSISMYLNKKIAVGFTLVMAVKSAFPTVDLNWLLTGQGDVFVHPFPPGSKDLIDQRNYYKHKCEQMEEDLAKLVLRHFGKTELTYERFSSDLYDMVAEKLEEYKK